MSGKICTFAHSYTFIFCSNKDSKRVGFRKWKSALIFASQQKFYRTAIINFQTIPSQSMWHSDIASGYHSVARTLMKMHGTLRKAGEEHRPSPSLLFCYMLYVIFYLDRLAIVAIMVAIEAKPVPSDSHLDKSLPCDLGLLGTMISHPGSGFAFLPALATRPFIYTI